VATFAKIQSPKPNPKDMTMQRWIANLPIIGKIAVPSCLLALAVLIACWQLVVTASSSVWVPLGITIVCSVVGFGLLAWIAVVVVSRPINQLAGAMERLVDNDLAVTVKNTDRRDEIGQIAHFIEVTKNHAIERRHLEETGAADALKREERRREVEIMTGTFDKTANDALAVVSKAAGELESTAQAMAATAEHTSDQATTVAAASDEVSRHVETVASAAEELSKSIAEISRQVALSTQVSRSASEEASRTTATVKELADSSARISDVLVLISGIAAQTNLLALNATIEAARAGEAGKGFAVVANEVKNLANQTGKATSDISAQIAAVQTATQDAVAAIEAIVGRIEEISHIAGAIASAVEEQSAATAEIAQNVQQAAEGTGQVSSIIGGVTKAAGETGGAAALVLASAQSLSQEAASLKTVVSSFLNDVFEKTEGHSRTFRFADVHPPTYPTVMTAEHIGKILSDKTGGRCVVKVFANSALGDEKYTVDQVKMGGLDMARVSLGNFQGTIAETMILSLPFLYRDNDHLRKVIHGPLGERVLAKFEPAGFIGLALLEAGARCIYARKPVRRLADVKGMKIRVQPTDLWLAFTKAIGANAIPMPMTEVHNGLMSGTVDAAENNYPTYESGKHYEVAAYYSETQHVMLPEILVFSKKIWDTLSDEERQTIRAAVKEAVPYYVKLWGEKEKTAKESLTKAGVKFIADVNKAEFVAAVKPVWDRFANTEELKKLVSDIVNTK
jgi:methyl-accepting chemotaxis protein